MSDQFNQIIIKIPKEINMKHWLTLHAMCMNTRYRYWYTGYWYLRYM
jgi:hypothetical protein